MHGAGNQTYPLVVRCLLALACLIFPCLAWVLLECWQSVGRPHPVEWGTYALLLFHARQALSQGSFLVPSRGAAPPHRVANRVSQAAFPVALRTLHMQARPRRPCFAGLCCAGCEVRCQIRQDHRKFLTGTTIVRARHTLLFDLPTHTRHAIAFGVRQLAICCTAAQEPSQGCCLPSSAVGCAERVLCLLCRGAASFILRPPECCSTPAAAQQLWEPGASPEGLTSTAGAAAARGGHCCAGSGAHGAPRAAGPSVGVCGRAGSCMTGPGDCASFGFCLQ